MILRWPVDVAGYGNIDVIFDYYNEMYNTDVLQIFVTDDTLFGWFPQIYLYDVSDGWRSYGFPWNLNEWVEHDLYIQFVFAPGGPPILGGTIVAAYHSSNPSISTGTAVSPAYQL